MTTKQAFEILQASRRLTPAEEAALIHLRRVYAKQMQVRTSDQQAYLKLYTYLLGSFYRHYNSHPDHTLVQKELHKIIGRPFDNLIEDLTDTINLNLMAEAIRVTGRASMGTWTPEEVRKELKMQAMEALVALHEQKQETA